MVRAISLLLSPAATTARNFVAVLPWFSKRCGRSASKVTLSPASRSWRSSSISRATEPASTTAVSRAPGSCSGGSPALPVEAPGSSACIETSARWPGSGGVSSSVSVAPPGAAAALASPNDDHMRPLVEAQQLGEAELEPGGDPRGHRQRRARLAALDLREHRRRDPAALGEVAERQAHGLAQRLDPRSHRAVLQAVGPPRRAYVITDARMRLARLLRGPDENLVDRDVLGL